MINSLLLQVLRKGLLLWVALFFWHSASADTLPTLFDSFAGNVNFIGTEKTRRTNPNTTNACSVLSASTANSATLSGLPSGATVLAAYLYWAGSGSTPDYDVIFEGGAVSADAARRYTATYSNFDFFSGVADVTTIVAAKGNGTYSFSGLTVDSGDPWCGSEAVLAGWSLAVIYSHSSEDYRIVNVYEGFQNYRNGSISITLGNFQTPSPLGAVTGKHAHITWEGDPTLSGGGEDMSFNGYQLTDANNPSGNQFNSISNIVSPVDTTSYGVDFDVYPLTSPKITPGMTSAATVYSSGNDLVLLSAEIMSVPNVPVADLAVSIVHVGTMTPGQPGTYSIDVNNNGPSIENGPVTVTITLPSVLTYASASGTGWVCSASGQTVTCTRSGSLAVGASAATITLNVNASSTANGVVSTKAVVAGTAFDNDAGNSSSTDNYVFTPVPYAYFAMDDGSWTTSVIDSSGNNRNGTALGGATPTGYPPASTPGAAIAGNPGTCGSGNFTANTSPSVDTGIQIRSSTVGNTGTIAFWYRSSTAWNDGNDRMLFDASINRGNAAADKHFYLVKGDTGRLRFAYEDSNNCGVTPRVASGHASTSFAANTWHHIAVSWNLPADQAYIYIDGVLAASDTSNCGNTLGEYLDTLYVGDNRSTGIDGTPGDYTTNSANGYLDEFRLYSGALTTVQVSTVMNTSHSCGGSVHHYELTLPSSGVTCQSIPVSVTACADSTSPCTSNVITLSGKTATLTASGASVASSTVTFNSAGVASTTLSNAAAANGATATVTLSNEQIVATNARKCCPDGASCSTANSCSITLNTSGFIISSSSGGAASISNQIAGVTSGTYYLRAVKTNSTTMACDAALTGATGVDFAYECVNPAACYAGNLMTVNGDTTGSASSTVISRNNSGSVSSYQTVSNLAFNGQGEAPFIFNYTDVGSVRLYARKAATGSLLTTLTGATNAFVVKPYGFSVSNIKCTTAISGSCAPGALALSPTGTNPAAADDTGGSFIQAGNPFSATVTAIAQSGTATPSYGKETAVEGVLLSSSLVAPAGGVNVTLGGTTTISGGSFSNGSATVTNLTWAEVGIITLSAAVADGDYLGAGNVSSTSGNIGRFIPDHFTITLPSITAACSTGTPFTYYGQDGFTSSLALTAQNVSNAKTSNYFSNYAKFTTTSYANYGFTATTLATGSVLAASGTVPSGVWSSGAVTTAAKHQVSRPSVVSAPNTVTLSAKPTDSDGVTAATTTVGTTLLRYGRLHMANAYGSELLALPIFARTEYYTGAGWSINGDDGCTVLTQPTAASSGAELATVFPTGTLAAYYQNTGSRHYAIGTVASGGNLNLSLSAPGSNNSGYTDIAVTAPSYLLIPGMTNNTTARATFGVFKTNNRIIYRRERY